MANYVLRRDPGSSDDESLGFQLGDTVDNLLTGERWYYGTKGGGWEAIAEQSGGGGGGLTGFTSSLNTTSPNDSVNASELLASGGTSNQDYVASPKGVGAFLLTLPTGDGTGGNKRGQNAVDLQIFEFGKNSATEVASGQFSFIGGGAQNTASQIFSAVLSGLTNNASAFATCIAGGEGNTNSGQYGFIGGGVNNIIDGEAYAFIGGGTNNSANAEFSLVCGGDSNTAQNQYDAVCGGIGNTASGGYSFVGGGDNNTADGQFSYIVCGFGGHTHGIEAYGVVSGGVFAAQGDAQLGVLPLRIATEDGSTKVLTSDGSAATASNQIILSDNSTFGFHGSVVARDNSANSSYWEFKGLIKRGSGESSTTLIGSCVASLLAQDSGASTWAVTLVADTVNGGLSVVVAGQSGATIHWMCRIETEELVF